MSVRIEGAQVVSSPESIVDLWTLLGRWLPPLCLLQAAVATLNSMQTVATASQTTGSTKEDKKAKVSRVVNFLQRVGLSVSV